MNKNIVDTVFKGTSEKIEEKKCPICSKSIDVSTEFKDELSVKEYYISGMCQSCQDDTFNESDNWDEWDEEEDRMNELESLEEDEV